MPETKHRNTRDKCSGRKDEQANRMSRVTFSPKHSVVVFREVTFTSNPAWYNLVMPRRRCNIFDQFQLLSNELCNNVNVVRVLIHAMSAYAQSGRLQPTEKKVEPASPHKHTFLLRFGRGCLRSQSYRRFERRAN